MADLFIGILIIAIVSAALLALGLWLGRRLPPRDVGLLIMFGVLILLAFEKFAWDKLWLARMLPFSNVVILGNWFPPLAAFLGGLAWQRLPGRRLRRGILIVPLLILSWAGIGRTVIGSPPPLQNRWTRGVCRQTSNASCSAAAAATLLDTVGISSDESEMARLCLTRPDGTSMLGLYRGLKVKTQGTGWKPVPFAGMSLEELERSMHGAVLLSVELEPGTKNAEHFRRWGWDVGMRHSVVIYEFLPGNLVEIGDPETGPELWTLEEFRSLWHGEAIRLEKR